jgi:O-antigen ligase
MSNIAKESKSILLKNILDSGTLSFYFAIMVLIVMPLYIWLVPPFMILWGISWIIENRKIKFKFDKEHRLQNWLLILFVVLYLWQLIGILYSTDVKTGWNTLISRLSLLLFPIVLFRPGKKIELNANILLKIFAGSTSLFILICYGYALYNSLSFHYGFFIFNPHPAEEYWMNYFYGSYFSINEHPSYLAMYAILSGFISFESSFDHSLGKWKRIGWLLNGILLIISLYFLSSRSGLLTIIILVPVYMVKKFFRTNKLISISALLLLLVFSILVVCTNERVKIGIGELSSDSFLAKDGRISIWSSALHSIRRNLIFGVGTGDVKAELMKEYSRRGDQNLIQNRYNVHNQYLEILMENGIIGLTIFLTILGAIFYSSFSEKNTIYYLFISMMLIFFLFETVMERLQGISFFALFSFLLIYSGKNSNQLKSST